MVGDYLSRAVCLPRITATVAPSSWGQKGANCNWSQSTPNNTPRVSNGSCNEL
jgi:hypothetical protein